MDQADLAFDLFGEMDPDAEAVIPSYLLQVREGRGSPPTGRHTEERVVGEHSSNIQYHSRQCYWTCSNRRSE